MNLGLVSRIGGSESALDGAEQGASSVEYGILVALIAAVVIVAVITLGATAQSLFESAHWW
jgi:Flp pilus assembly pilin Flp